MKLCNLFPVGKSVVYASIGLLHVRTCRLTLSEALTGQLQDLNEQQTLHERSHGAKGEHNMQNC
jgi:hypothetical protein